jgi:hypothetical protein
VGHSKKLTRSRDDESEVTLVRRDSNITIDGGKGGLGFVGLVQEISDSTDMAETMYDMDFDEILHEQNGTQDENPDSHHPSSGIAS